MQSPETQLLNPLAYLPSQHDFSETPPQPLTSLSTATGDLILDKREAKKEDVQKNRLRLNHIIHIHSRLKSPSLHMPTQHI